MGGRGCSVAKRALRRERAAWRSADDSSSMTHPKLELYAIAVFSEQRDGFQLRVHGELRQDGLDLAANGR